MLARITQSPWQAVALLILLWAGLYLPGLGMRELQGEEARRILPARNMLVSGDFLVPRIGGEVYSRKPPLINWLIAGSFSFFQKQNAWTARLPSALALLAASVLMFCWGRSFLGNGGGLLAGLFLLSNIGLLEKGRLAEIESLLISLCAIACVLWAHLWVKRSSPWFTYVLPWGVMGLGMLMKGPVAPFFFYVFVLCVLFKARRVREFFALPHFVGVVLMLGIFFAWALPNAEAVESLKGVENIKSSASSVWIEELWIRFVPKNFSVGEWLGQPLQGLLNFMPWILFLPLLWGRKAGGMDFKCAQKKALYEGGKWALIIGYGSIAFLPKSEGRFTMALIPIACLLLALHFSLGERRDFPSKIFSYWHRAYLFLLSVVVLFSIASPFITPHKNLAPALIFSLGALFFLFRLWRKSGRIWKGNNKQFLPHMLACTLQTCLPVIIAVGVFFSGVVHRVIQEDDVRPTAKYLQKNLPPDTFLHLYKPKFQPFLFYLPVNSYGFIRNKEELSNPEMEFLLLPEKQVSNTQVQKLMRQSGFKKKTQFNGDRTSFTLFQKSVLRDSPQL